MVRKQSDDIQGLILINALLYILCIPNILSPILEVGLGTAAFLLSAYIAYTFFKFGERSMFRCFAFLTLIYNPIFLFVLNTKNWTALDLSIAVSLFILAAGLYKFNNKALAKLTLAILALLALLFAILFIIFLLPLTVK